MDELLEKLLKEDEFEDIFQPINKEEEEERSKEYHVIIGRIVRPAVYKWIKRIDVKALDMQKAFWKALPAIGVELNKTLFYPGDPLYQTDEVQSMYKRGEAYKISYRGLGSEVFQIENAYGKEYEFRIFEIGKEEENESRIVEDEFEDNFKPADKNELGKREEGLKAHLAKGGELPEDMQEDLLMELMYDLTGILGDFGKSIKKQHPNIAKEIITNKSFQDKWEDMFERAIVLYLDDLEYTLTHD